MMQHGLAADYDLRVLAAVEAGTAPAGSPPMVPA